jgi:hypothetical protein
MRNASDHGRGIGMKCKSASNFPLFKGGSRGIFSWLRLLIDQALGNPSQPPFKKGRSRLVAFWKRGAGLCLRKIEELGCALER